MSDMGDYDYWQGVPPKGGEVGMGGGILGASEDRSDLRLARASPLRGLVSGTTSGDVWPLLWGATGYPTTREGTPELPFLRGDGGGMGTRRDVHCILVLGQKGSTHCGCCCHVLLG